MPYKDKDKEKKYKKKYYKKNIKRINEYFIKYYYENKKDIIRKNIEYYKKNVEKIKKRTRDYRKKNAEKIKAYDKFRYKRERNKRIEFGRKYYIKNKKNIIRKNVKYAANKLKTDPSFRLKANLRRRTLYALKGKDKSANTMKLLGVKNIEFVWKHLEKSFKPGMTRENHGKWHVDHIKPCSSFDLTKASEQRECFHYTNLQPLWASENLAKGSKIS
jgi:hypothetical protein